jgi:hypothetical protein
MGRLSAINWDAYPITLIYGEKELVLGGLLLTAFEREATF